MDFEIAHIQEGGLSAVGREAEGEADSPFLYGYENIQKLRDTGEAPAMFFSFMALNLKHNALIFHS